jgi:hypothetical protein
MNIRHATTVALKVVLTSLVVLGVVACPVFCLYAGNTLDGIWNIDGDDDEI